MSYAITVYCNDATIKKTSVNITTAGTFSGTYGSSSLGDYDEFSVADLDSSWYATFSVTPASGCSFYRWVYRIGSTSASVQYNYSSTFKYTDGQDIYIRAEGTQDVEAWDLETDSFGSISSSVSSSFTLNKMTMYRFDVFFNSSGTATFYTTGSVDTYGYVGQSSSFDDINGEPSSYHSEDDDGADDGGNFRISRNVSAGSRYYVWVRGYNKSTSGSVTLHIKPPAGTWSLSSSSLGTLTVKITESISINSYTLYRRTVTFSKSGTAKFYTTGTSADTYGYLSTSDAWDNTTGRPTDYLTYDDDGNGDANFLISYNVTAGTTYYVWVRAYSSTASGNTALHITVPEEKINIEKWSWSASNGSASASLTSAAYDAVVNKTAVTNFSYLVWNDLCDKVKEILDETSNSWNSSYATYANTKMSSSSKTLTATKFNSLRYNIGYHYSTGISEVATNDDVLGSYFTKLASCINSWIDTL